MFTLEKKPSLERNVDSEKLKRWWHRIFGLYSQISKAVYSLQEIVHSNAIFAESVKYLPICVGSFCGNWQKPPFVNKDKSIKQTLSWCFISSLLTKEKYLTNIKELALFGNMPCCRQNIVMNKWWVRTIAWIYECSTTPEFGVHT